MEQQEKLTFVAVTEKPTVKAIRFEEVVPPGADPVSNTIYVQKKALARIGNPGIIEVTIAPARKE